MAHTDTNQKWAETHVPAVHRFKFLGVRMADTHPDEVPMTSVTRFAIEWRMRARCRRRPASCRPGHGPVRQMGEPNDRGAERRAEHLAAI